MFPEHITQTERCCSKAVTSAKSPERQHWEKLRTAGVGLEGRGASEEASIRPSVHDRPRTPHGRQHPGSTPVGTPKQQIQSTTFLVPGEKGKTGARPR